MTWILAPFALAFGLFAVYLVVALFLKDPARPFRMFKAPPLNLDECEEQSAKTEEGTGED